MCNVRSLPWARGGALAYRVLLYQVVPYHSTTTTYELHGARRAVFVCRQSNDSNLSLFTFRKYMYMNI